MIFLKAKLPRVFEIHLESESGGRRFFARTWCQSRLQWVVPVAAGEKLYGDEVQPSIGSFCCRNGRIKSV
jgi:hypothetical protein